ncbi:MAG TPA: potassium channel family protein [Stellaceae bacterium]|nr:potassium channel family protein [Stellaceae bacterium]
MRRIAASLATGHEAALTVLLVVQCAVLFVAAPLVIHGGPGALFAADVLVVAFGVLLVALSEGRGPTLLAGIIAVFTLAAAVLNVAAPTRLLLAADHIGSTVILLLVGYVVSRAVFAQGPVTAHRVRGAIVLYLTFGIAFSTVFRLLDEWSPGAFAGIAADAPRTETFASLIYFSFVTLTSVGYGDISPVHPFARSMTNLEAVIGQLYPATLLARLVTLHLETRRRS